MIPANSNPQLIREAYAISPPKMHISDFTNNKSVPTSTKEIRPKRGFDFPNSPKGRFEDVSKSDLSCYLKRLPDASSPLFSASNTQADGKNTRCNFSVERFTKNGVKYRIYKPVEDASKPRPVVRETEISSTNSFHLQKFRTARANTDAGQISAFKSQGTVVSKK
jgi:hypothetical protein